MFSPTIEVGLAHKEAFERAFRNQFPGEKLEEKLITDKEIVFKVDFSDERKNDLIMFFGRFCSLSGLRHKFVETGQNADEVEWVPANKAHYEAT